jgi:hypothetical protein
MRGEQSGDAEDVAHEGDEADACDQCREQPNDEGSFEAVTVQEALPRLPLER